MACGRCGKRSVSVQPKRIIKSQPRQHNGTNKPLKVIIRRAAR